MQVLLLSFSFNVFVDKYCIYGNMILSPYVDRHANIMLHSFRCDIRLGLTGSE